MCECSRFAAVPSARYSRRNVVGRILISLSILLALGASSSAFATDGVWGNSSGGLWTNVDNWVGQVANGTDGIADFSTLNITTDVTVHLDSARTIGSLQFGDTTPSNNWLLDNNGNAADILTLGVTSGSPTITVVNDSATISATLTGTQGITKSGAGTLTLSGNNTFTGGVTINAGNLQLGNAGALNSPTPNAVAFGPNSSGILSLNGNSVTISSLSSNVAVGTPIVQNGGAAFAALTVNNAVDNTFAGILQGGNANSLLLIKSGNGTLTLSGNNTFSGGVEVNAGTLSLSGNNTFPGGLLITGGTVQMASAGALSAALPDFVTFGSSSTGVLSLNGNSVTLGLLDTGTPVGTPVVSNNSPSAATLTVNTAFINTTIFAGVLKDGLLSAPLSLTKAGINKLVLSGANTFTGPVHVNDGTLELSEPQFVQAVSGNLFVGDGIGAPGSAVLLTDNGVVFPASGANVTLQSDGVLNFGAAFGETINVLNMTGGTITGGNGAFTCILNSDVTTNASGTTAVLAASGYSVFLNGPVRTFTVAQGTTPSGIDLDVAAPFSVSSSGIIKNGLGTMRLSGNSGFSGGVALNAGTLIIGNTYALGTGTLTAGGGALQADSNGPYTIANPVNLSSTLTVGGSNSFTLSGPISGSGVLTKIGSGVLTLSGVDNFTGPINVNGGTLAMSGGSLTANVQNQAAFIYNSGTFSGRLTNLGTVVLNADFTAGNGIENDGNFALATGRAVTLNGAGLDNEGTFTMSGGVLNLNPAGSNVNRGNFNLTANLGLGAATFTNSGTLALSGGLVSGASGTLTNAVGGVVSGTGTIQSTFNNSGGLLAVGTGTMNVTQAFTNSGLIQLNSFSANLVGGTINNTGSIRGIGSIGNPVTNNGDVEPFGGILFLSGSLLNPTGGLIRVAAGNQLVVNSGLAANVGIINLTGGTFDNNNKPLNNLGQISGWGTFASGGAGLDNNGSITFTGGPTTVNGPLTDENGRTITVAYNPALFTGMVTNNGGGTFTTLSTTATFAAGFTNNGNSNFAAVGNGSIDVPVAPALGSASSLAVGGSSTMRFSPASGSATVGTGVTATVSNSATLELAGSVSAVSSGVNRVNVTNNSTAAAGILVSGTNQVVGAIDGSGNTVVNAGSDLTANHIIQGALVVGGTAGSHGIVTIDTSDASGNPLGQPSGLALSGSLTPSTLFGVGGISAANLSSGGLAALGVPSFGDSVERVNPSVPEPSTLLLALLTFLGVVSTQFVRRYF